MNFVHAYYLPHIIVALLIFSILVMWNERRFFRWVRDHWFFRRRKRSRLASFLFLIGFSCMMLGVLDLRGKEERLKGEIPDQRTIILIDASASMLAEDVRPNRFQKAALLARHFLSKAIGHQVSIILFSDTTRKLVPFTSDIDLLTARLSALATMDISRGGSSLKNAIMESVQFFKSGDVSDSDVQGNLLVFTDAEETEEGIELKVPKNISVALIGVGTVQGAPIPLRDKSNVFSGYKQFHGEQITSRLNEEAMRALSSKIRYYRYWVASSFSLPTEEIMDFFSRSHLKKNEQGDIVIRPVLAQWIVIPGIVCVILSCLLRMSRTFVAGLLLLFSFQASPNDDSKKLENSEKQLTEKMKKGEITSAERLKLAEIMLRQDKTDKALTLYSENFGKKQILPNDIESTLNYGTALLKSGRLPEGMAVYDELRRHLEKTHSNQLDAIQEIIRTNTRAAFQEQEKKKNNPEEQKKENNEEKKEDDKKKGQENDKKQDQQNEKKDQQKDKQNDSSQKDMKKPGKDNLDQLKDKKNEPKKDEQKKNGPGPTPTPDSKPDSSNDKEKQERASRPQKLNSKIELKPMLNQLVDEDRSLQQKLLDTTTKDRVRQPDKKDW